MLCKSVYFHNRWHWLPWLVFPALFSWSNMAPCGVFIITDSQVRHFHAKLQKMVEPYWILPHTWTILGAVTPLECCFPSQSAETCFIRSTSCLKTRRPCCGLCSLTWGQKTGGFLSMLHYLTDAHPAACGSELQDWLWCCHSTHQSNSHVLTDSDVK